MSERSREVRRQRRLPGGSPHRINIRTTTETYARLVAGAAIARLSLPRYLIESALRRSSGGWSLREQRWWTERLDVVETRMIRIGTNLNHMATVANATGQLPGGLVGALRYLEATLDHHRQILAAIDPADRTRR